jgi:hypothetical protein
LRRHRHQRSGVQRLDGKDQFAEQVVVLRAADKVLVLAPDGVDDLFERGPERGDGTPSGRGARLADPG